ncbi:hypothetical protein [Acinetobacter baumannii]|uniref:hypothetical protein n=1 Tax=Acinetobacter baumannii TaxID=470 RepID=UPI00338F2267
MLTVFIVLGALIVISSMLKMSKLHTLRNEQTRLRKISLTVAANKEKYILHKMRLATMSPEEAFMADLTNEELEEYLSLTTTLERLSFKVDIAGDRIQKTGNEIQLLTKSLKTDCLKLKCE